MKMFKLIKESIHCKAMEYMGKKCKKEKGKKKKK